MTDKCKFHESELHQVSHDVKLIKAALLGNEYSDNKGLIYKYNKLAEELKELDKKLEQADIKSSKKAGFVGGISAVIGYALAWTTKIFAQW